MAQLYPGMRSVFIATQAEATSEQLARREAWITGRSFTEFSVSYYDGVYCFDYARKTSRTVNALIDAPGFDILG